MKIIIALAAACGFLGLITYSFNKMPVNDAVKENVETTAKTSAATSKPLVLVELFTSEGCSSCPPADRALIFLEKEQPYSEAEIVPLAMHVDYWNRLGWTDKFSASDYSRRQEFYSNTFKLDGVYTPQMVVDGARQFVGGNLDEAHKAVTEAAKSPKANVELTLADDKLKINITELPAHSFANVFLAIAENNLSTEVKRGENGGATLPHTAVVRELKTIGTISDEMKNFNTETAFKLQPDWKKENLKLVVFVQTEQGSRIIGVNQIKL